MIFVGDKESEDRKKKILGGADSPKRVQGICAHHSVDLFLLQNERLVLIASEAELLCSPSKLNLLLNADDRLRGGDGDGDGQCKIYPIHHT